MAADFEVPGYENPVEIGRGGFGTVYRAHQPRFNRTVAIKVLNARPGEDARRRFEHECLALGTVSGHPNIVEVFDSGLTPEGLPYLVTAFVHGGTLADRLSRRGPLPADDAVVLVIKLAGALATAHAHDILHRDVKPENVLVSEFGEPMLADFGLARLEGRDVTHTTGVTASFAHAAPEIMEGKPATVAADVYSLGSTLFTLVAGSPPFARAGDEGLAPLIARTISQPVPDLRPAGVPPGVCACIEAAMAKDPAARTATARELGARLQITEAAEGRSPTPMLIGSRHSEPVPEVLTPAATVGPAGGVVGETVAPPRPGPAPGPPPAGLTEDADTLQQHLTPPTPTPVVPVVPPVVTERPGPVPAPVPVSARSRSRGLAVAVVVVAVVALAVGVAAAAGVFSASKRAKENFAGVSGPATTTITTAPVDAGRAVAAHFADLLQRNSGARAEVVTAVADVSNCSLDGNDGATNLGGAITTRQGIVDDLNGIDASGLPEGSQLKSSLTLALQDSIAADGHFQDWMRFVASFGCNGTAAQNSDYAAANASSQAATASKNAFVSAWNPVATRYGLAQVQEQGL